MSQDSEEIEFNDIFDQNIDNSEDSQEYSNDHDAAEQDYQQEDLNEESSSEQIQSSLLKEQSQKLNASEQSYNRENYFETLLKLNENMNVDDENNIISQIQKKPKQKQKNTNSSFNSDKFKYLSVKKRNINGSGTNSDSNALSEEILQIIENDGPDFQKQLQQIEQNISEVQPQLFERVQHSISKYNIENGIGLLDAKNIIFIDYLTNLNLYILQKINGEELNQDLIKQMIYQKLLLSRLKPLEKKLDYQINKLLRLNLNNTNDSAVKAKGTKGAIKKQMNEMEEEQDEQEFGVDKLQFKPRPDQLAKENNKEDLDEDEEGDDLDDDEEIDSSDVDGEDGDNNQIKAKKQKQKVQVYVPPKISSSLNKEDRQQEKFQRQAERNKLFLRRKLKDSLMKNTINEKEDNFYDQVNEQKYNDDDKYLDKGDRERIRFEEDNYTRLPITKKDKIKMKKRQKQQQFANEERLDDFQEFTDIRNLLRYEKLIDDKRENDQNKQKIRKTLGIQMNKKKIQKQKKFQKRR